MILLQKFAQGLFHNFLLKTAFFKEKIQFGRKIKIFIQFFYYQI